MAPKMAQLALDNKIEANNFPQVVLPQMYQAVASKSPGVITKTGLKTFVDPRIEGGKMNDLAKEDLVKLINLEGEEWLFYPRLDFNVGLVRGTTIDKNGNISFEEEPAILEVNSLC
jgi:propionate CoA-transferase